MRSRIILMSIICCLLFTSSFAQKVDTSKIRKKGMQFDLTIKGVGYKKFVKNFVEKHASKKLWIKRVADSCKNKVYTCRDAAYITVILSCKLNGEVKLNSRFYTSEFIKDDDVEFNGWIKAMVAELEQTIKNYGIVKPPIDAGVYYDTEIELEHNWNYKQSK